MYKIASLLRQREDDSLDVCVEFQDFDNRQDAKTRIGNIIEHTVIGMICFQDERPVEDILSDFAETYRAAKRKGIDVDGKYGFIKYEKQFEIIIPMAFIDYFSRRV